MANKHAVPGKLLTGKGPIPGELGAFGTVWGKISATGDDAERMMGFRPKEGAIGVLLTRRKYIDANGKQKKGIFATSLMPREMPDTEKMRATTERMRIITHIASKYHDDLVVPIWNPLIKDDRKKPYTGHHYFMSANLKGVGVGLRWKRLVISKGALEPLRRIYSHWYDRETNEIRICIPPVIKDKPLSVNQIGIGIIDVVTGDFFHITPEEVIEFDKERTYIWELENLRENYNPKGRVSYKSRARFYIYMYYRREKSENRKQKDAIPKQTRNDIYDDIPKEVVSLLGFRDDISEPRRQKTGFIYSPSISSRIRGYKNKERKRDWKLIRIKVKDALHHTVSL